MPHKKHTQGGIQRQGKTRRVGALIANAVTPVCQQNGFIQARIVLEWDHIVPQFSQLCTPVKIKFPWPQRHNGRLIVRATGSMAVQIVYYEPVIVEKINQYFGYQAVSSLTFDQGVSQGGGQGPFSLKPPSKKAVQKPLPDETRSSLEAQVQPIEDDRLRAALLSLGAGIFQEKANEKAKA